MRIATVDLRLAQRTVLILVVLAWRSTALSQGPAKPAGPPARTADAKTVPHPAPVSPPAVRDKTGPATLDPSKIEQTIQAELDKSVTIDFSDTPFSEVADFLHQRTNLKIVLDNAALQEEGVTTDTPISLNVAGVRLRSALALMLNQLNLTFRIQNDVLWITTRTRAEERERLSEAMFLDRLQRRPAQSKLEQAIQDGLDKPISLDFSDTPLHEVAGYLRKATGWNIVFDLASLQEEGVTTDTPVTLKLDGIRVRSALNLLLHQLNSTWLIENDVLLITSKTKAKERHVASVPQAAGAKWLSDLVLTSQGVVMADSPAAAPSPSRPATPEKGKGKGKDQASNAGIGNLEALLAAALKENPDLRLAEARLRQAEAVLNLMRLKVVQSTVALHRSWEAQKKAVELTRAQVEDLRKKYETIQAMHKSGTEAFTTMVEAERALKEGQMALVRAEEKLAAIEATAPYLTGKQPQAGPRPAIPGNDGLGEGFEGSGGFGGSPPPAGGFAGAPVRGVMMLDKTASIMPLPAGGFGETPGGGASKQRGVISDDAAVKLRKALDTTVNVNFSDVPLSEVLELFQKSAHFEFHYPKELGTLRIRLHLRNVSLGAALEAIEDTGNGGAGALRFWVREYGILCKSSAEAPEGAIPLVEFWKER